MFGSAFNIPISSKTGKVQRPIFYEDAQRKAKVGNRVQNRLQGGRKLELKIDPKWESVSVFSISLRSLR
jgi:hypothetical protein